MNPTSPRSAVFYSTIRHWGWGAPDYVWPTAATELLARGIPVTAVVRPQIRDHPQIVELAARGARVLDQPPLIFRRGRLSELKTAWLRLATSTRALRAAFASARQPHVFIDQSASFDFLDEAFLQRLVAENRVSYDVFFRSNCYTPPLAAGRRSTAVSFLGRASRTLFNSQWTRELTELQLVHHLSNARYFPHLVRFPRETPLPWPDDPIIRLASVSRIDAHHKGLDVLLQALARLPAGLPAWTLDLFGRGPDTDYLRELAAWLGIADRVRFRDFAVDVPAVWRECHLLVLVSRYEGLGVAMIESMACGRPVLRTPYGGYAEWIVPGETGFICPAAEPSLIAETLRHALEKFSHWPAMGRAAHARTQAQVDPHPESIYLEPFQHTSG